jgi:hypothetical protein
VLVEQIVTSITIYILLNEKKILKNNELLPNNDEIQMGHD